MREEGRVCTLQMLQKLGVHGTMSRPGCADPPCLVDIRREYSAFVLSAFLLQASLPSFSEFVAIACPVPPVIHLPLSLRDRYEPHTHSLYA